MNDEIGQDSSAMTDTIAKDEEFVLNPSLPFDQLPLR
jgi:hypothetical protein